MIAATLATLFPDAPVIELRILDQGRTDSGYFNDYAQLEKIAVRYNGTSNVYFTINPVNPDLIARASNRVMQRVKITTADKDIVTRRYLPIDFDPVRPTGISSSDTEHKDALIVAGKARDYLTNVGWPQPIEIDSGNGAHLYYAIDLPNDDMSKQLLKDCLDGLDRIFSTDSVHVDKSIFNASRIMRLPGTKNTKGDNTVERPHRLAQVLRTPDTMVAVSQKLLEHLAGAVPKAPKADPLTPRFDLDKWLHDLGLTVVRKIRHDNAMMYRLDHCVFNVEHDEAAIFQFDNGGFHYHCFHDSCVKNTWKAFTKLYPLPNQSALKSAKIITKLNDLGYYFKLNECADRIEVNGLPLTNALADKIDVQMADKGVKPLTIVPKVYHANALDNAYHPIKDYLGSIAYDQSRDYIYEVAQHLHDVHTPSVAHTWLKRWLIGAVAKVYEAEQNPMLVLDGPQDIGKSTFVRWLASAQPIYFIEGAIKPDDKDSYIRLIQSWIWEVSELDATTRKSDVAALKDFITRRVVTVRRAYDRYDLFKPALASMIGTVNDDGSGFLADTTGNRRFLVMTLNRIDWGYMQIPIDQVWAQAVWYYKNDEPWILSPAEKQQRDGINKNYEPEDPYSALLHKYFEIEVANMDLWVASRDILTMLYRSDQVKGSIKSVAMDLAKVCKKLHLVKGRKGDLQGYHGLKAKEQTLVLYPRVTQETN